jgi:hypothetical protein
VRPTLVLIAAILALPIGWTVQSRSSTATQIQELQLRNATLLVESTRYRSTATELSGSIAALQLAIGELRHDSIVDPEIRRAILQLPEADTASGAALRAVALSSPTDTFNLLGVRRSDAGQPAGRRACHGTFRVPAGPVHGPA